MSAPELGTWEPLGLDLVVETFSSAPFRWWVSGGHALDLHLGRTWREHEDTDVGVVRSDVPQLRVIMSHWDIHVAAAGQLTPWRGEPLESAPHQNNLWCRLTGDGPWVLDVTIGEGSGDCWIYRRDPSVQVPWAMAVLRTAEGIPYLAPELQLLYKSKEFGGRTTSMRPRSSQASMLDSATRCRDRWPQGTPGNACSSERRSGVWCYAHGRARARVM